MKKLMTMLAAVATAFGLYAADAGFISGAGFDSTDADETLNLTWTHPSGFVDGFWTGTDGTNAIITAGTSRPSDSTDRPARFLSEDDIGRAYDGYLTLNTGTGLVGANILAGGDAQTIGDDGFYFDGLVQFTAFDEMPVIAEDAKIAMFPMLNDSEDESQGTNLWIYAYGTETNFWKTAATLDGEWHRVTIKMINNILKSGTQVGFVVYVDGSAVSCMAAQGAFDANDLTSEAKYYYTDGKLFGAVGEYSAEVSEVAFGGKGAIDEIAFTETAPSFAGSPKFAYLTGAENIDSFKYSTETWNAGDEPLEVMLVGSDTGMAAVFDIKAAPTYFPVQTSDEVEVTAGETTPVGEAKSLGATVVIDDVPQYFETAAEAFDELLNQVTAPTEATLTLNAETSDAIELKNANVTLTLDLAGKTIEVAEGNAINVVAGTLTIVDTDPEKKGAVITVYDTEESVWPYAVNSDSADVTIEAGTFDGQIFLGGESSSITGGKFLKAANEDGSLDSYNKDETKEFGDDDSGNYWTLVSAAPKTGTVIFICEKTAFTNKVVDVNIDTTIDFPANYETDATIGKGWFKDQTLTTPVVEGDEKVVAGETTYWAKAVDAVAKVGTEKFETAAAALAKVQELEQNPDNFPITVTAIADGLEITDPAGTDSITLAKDATVVITADGWAFTGDVEGEVTLAAGKSITVPTGLTNFKVNAPDGYAVVPQATMDTVTYTVAPYVAQINEGTKYLTLAEAAAAAQNGDTITLLADIPEETLTTTAKPTSGHTYYAYVTAAKVIDLNGKKIAHRVTGVGSDVGTYFKMTGSEAKTFKNGDVGQYKGGVWVQAEGDLTIDGITSHHQVSTLGAGELVVKNCFFKNDLNETGTTDVSDTESKNYTYFSFNLAVGVNFTKTTITGNTFYQARRCCLQLTNLTGPAYVYGNTFDGTKQCLTQSELTEGRKFGAAQIYGQQAPIYIEHNSYAGEWIAEPFTMYNEKSSVITEQPVVFNDNTVAATVPYLWFDYLSTEAPGVSVTNMPNVIWSGLSKVDAAVDRTKGQYKAQIDPNPTEVEVEDNLALPTGISYCKDFAGDYYVNDQVVEFADIKAGDTVIVLPGASLESDALEFTLVEGFKNKYTVAAKVFEVTFAKGAEGAEGTQAAVPYTYGASVTAPVCTFTYTGYDFVAWTNVTAGGAAIAAGAALDTTVIGGYTLTAVWAEKSTPGVAPGGSPVNVEAKDEDEALSKVPQIEVDPPAEAAAAVTKTDYNAYFVKKAADLGDGTFNVYLDLKPEIVKAADETTALAGKLGEISAAAEGEVDVAITNAKPGLYYSVIEGQQLTGRTEGEKTLATGTSVTIKTTKFANSGFYQINVSASNGLTGGQQ